MSDKLLHALHEYIAEVNTAIHTVADIGPGTDLSRLSEMTRELQDAIQQEKIDQ